MKVSSPHGLFETQELETYTCVSARSGQQALLMLHRDEAEFIDAATAIYRDSAPAAAGAACWLDWQLWEAALLAKPGASELLPTFRFAVALIQAHCLARYGIRFQGLRVRAQRAVLRALDQDAGLGEHEDVRALSSFLKVAPFESPLSGGAPTCH